MSTLRSSLSPLTCLTRSAGPAAAPMIAIAVAVTIAVALLAAAGPALAQYKVVGADGKVTYTDRPTAADAAAQVLPLRRDGLPSTSATNAGPPLPTELRAVVARFPVTLFTSSGCSPCDTGRKLLQQRGVPYSEKLVGSEDDIAALQRLSGGRTVPALTVGGQAMRGYLETDWLATLDLAGYPRDSRLPRGWQAPPPAPLVARTPVEAPMPNATNAANAPAARQPAEPVVSPTGSTGIRF